MYIDGIQNIAQISTESLSFNSESKKSIPSNRTGIVFGEDSVELSEEAQRLIDNGLVIGSNDSDNALASDDPSKKDQELREEAQIQKLKKRDQEVKTHEMTHAGLGGQYSGMPIYEYSSGPDGQKYATGGHVNFDASKESTPEETIQKAQIIKRAVLAPMNPSQADKNIAQKMDKMAAEARKEIQDKKLKENKENNNIEEDSSLTSQISAKSPEMNQLELSLLDQILFA